jgi:hypothetical protein
LPNPDERKWGTEIAVLRASPIYYIQVDHSIGRRGKTTALMTEEPAAKRCALSFLVLIFAGLKLVKAQDNYEIQVYGSDTVAPKTTMVPLN